MQQTELSDEKGRLPFPVQIESRRTTVTQECLPTSNFSIPLDGYHHWRELLLAGSAPQAHNNSCLDSRSSLENPKTFLSSWLEGREVGMGEGGRSDPSLELDIGNKGSTGVPRWLVS